jgi:hypothetical protein
LTFQLGDGAAPRLTHSGGGATLIAGSYDTPRGLGCRYVNRKAETEAEYAKPGPVSTCAFGIVHAAIRDRARPIIRSDGYMRQTERDFKRGVGRMM